MPTIGLTGTVGCGKSFALRILEELGAATLQADQVGHDLLGEPEVIREVVALFGEEVLLPEGGLSRKKIGERVFADPDAMAKYNAIIHPRLLERLRGWLSSHRVEGGVAVIEAALIPEWGIGAWFDEVWCIRCSDNVALSRWKGDPAVYWNIRKAQFAPERKWAQAERVIDNERSQEEFRGRIETEYQRCRARSSASCG